MNDAHNDETRLTADVTHGSCMGNRHCGHAPGLAIDYRGHHLVFTAGTHDGDAHVAREFAIGLASTALGFAGACNRLLPAGPFSPTPESAEEPPWPT